MKIYIVTEIETNTCQVTNYVFSNIEEAKAHFFYVCSEYYASEENIDMENLCYSEEGFTVYVKEHNLN
jgi:hypothetical protein